MAKLVLTPTAIRTIDRHRDFLAVKNPQAATKAVVTITTSVSRLVDMPLLGKRVEGMHNHFELITRFGEGSYTALYEHKIGGDIVSVINVKHSKEDGYKD